MRFAVAQLVRFAWLEALSCLFPFALFAGLAVSQVVPLPMARYDALLVYCLVLTFGFRALRLETWREVAVIFGFHLVGLGLELFKVRHGSWTYPGPAVTRVGGVPLFAGFMYAAVGSYICQAWRRLDLRVSGYRPVLTTVCAVLIYANFYTHHWIADLRVPIAVLLLVVLRRTWVFYSVGSKRYRMPLALSFALIGFFLWLAENAGTFLDAWNYPDQTSVWTLVHPAKFGAWSLLVSMSFVLVATVKGLEGRLYHRGAPASVISPKATVIEPQPAAANPPDGCVVNIATTPTLGGTPWHAGSTHSSSSDWSRE
ncbi:MAG TPA: DUF817 domain-containing protein [Kribbellaceae bacterium]